MTRLDQLAKLQALDSQIQENERAQERLKVTLEDNSAVAAAESASLGASRRLHELRARLTSMELEVSSLTDKIKAVEARLFDGSVTSPKELGGLQQDELMLKRQKSQVEDQMLEVMAEIETAEGSASSHGMQLERISAERRSEASKGHAQLEELAARGRELSRLQTNLRGQIGPADLNLYDNLRHERKGVAVAHLKGIACSGCGFALPSGHAARVRLGTELVSCPNCGRILIP